MKTLIISLKIFIIFTVLTGVIYPFLITGIAQVVFPVKANGSLVTDAGRKIGSGLIGQHFDSPAYFTSRPSQISYDPLPSGGSNYALTNRKLRDLVSDRRKEFVSFNKLDTITEIPSEMLFASASGLDPHISPQAARMQASRIAGYRNFTYRQKEELLDLIKNLTEEPQFHLLGNERINVFLLNLSLDRIK